MKLGDKVTVLGPNGSVIYIGEVDRVRKLSYEVGAYKFYFSSHREAAGSRLATRQGAFGYATTCSCRPYEDGDDQQLRTTRQKSRISKLLRALRGFDPKGQQLDELEANLKQALLALGIPSN